MTIPEVQKLAELARIAISDDEAKELGDNLESVLGYVAELNEVTLEMADGVTGSVYNQMRDDRVTHERGQYTDAILSNAPDTQDGFIKVKKVL